MTTRFGKSLRSATPTGREEVAAAILEAATDLFAERGPAATSIRDIAARSKVNHGLVFRHFGTKDQLVGAVLDHLGTTLTDLLDSGAPADVVERALDRQMRVMARTLLDGYPAAQLQKRFPNIADLLDWVRQSTAMTRAVRGWRSPMPLRCSSVGGCSRRSCARPPGSTS